MNIEVIKQKIEELLNLQKNKKAGYSCGWADACRMILGIIDSEEHKNISSSTKQ